MNKNIFNTPFHTRIHWFAFLSTTLPGCSENRPHRHWSNRLLPEAADRKQQLSQQPKWDQHSPYSAYKMQPSRTAFFYSNTTCQYSQTLRILQWKAPSGPRLSTCQPKVKWVGTMQNYKFYYPINTFLVEYRCQEPLILNLWTPLLPNTHSPLAVTQGFQHSRPRNWPVRGSFFMISVVELLGREQLQWHYLFLNLWNTWIGRQEPSQ